MGLPSPGLKSQEQTFNYTINSIYSTGAEYTFFSNAKDYIPRQILSSPIK